MYDDLMDWQDDNPAPAIIMLISDEPVDFLGDILALLQQQQKYNLFWAYSFRPREMSIMLTSAEWLWDRLLAGVFFFYLSSIHFHIYIYKLITEL